MVPDAEVEAGAWYCFRHSFEIKPDHSQTDPRASEGCGSDQPRIRIACDSKYWLFIDGELLVREGGLKRGPTPNGTYYDDVKLPFEVGPGRHVLGILLWFFGRNGFSHHNSGCPGLIYRLSGGGAEVVSEASVRAIRHSAFVEGNEPFPNYRLPESNVTFDARTDHSGWAKPGFDDTHWPLVREAGGSGARPWGQLVRRPTPMFRFEESRSLSDGRSIECDGSTKKFPIGGNRQVLPWIEVDAAAGLSIDLRTDNYFGGGVANVRATYVTREGRQRFESPAWMNGHELHVTAPVGVKLIDVGVRESRFDTPWLGSFSCEDERIERLWRKSRATLDVCMRDTYMDCPDRERAQWWGDVVIQMGSAFYACDAERSPTLARKAIDELIGWQRVDGSMYSPVPAGLASTSTRGDEGHWEKELPAQMLASVGHFGFWTYYWYSGDRETLLRSLPAVRRYLALWRFDPATGLVDHRAGGWDWVDWGANVDTPVNINAWYALALRGHMQACRVAGLDDEAERCRERIARMHEGFNRAFWKGDGYRGDDSLPMHDDRAQAMAVLAGFVDGKRAEGVIEVLDTTHHAGPYMEKYIVEALFQLGETERALTRLMRRYAEQIDGPTETLWEGWSVNDATWGGGTYNHAWSGGAITLLQQYVAGIAPTAAGFERFSVRPAPGRLRRIRSVVPTRFGLIRLALDRDAGECRIEVPAQTIAQVLLPGVPPTMLTPGEHVMVIPKTVAITSGLTGVSTT